MDLVPLGWDVIYDLRWICRGGTPDRMVERSDRAPLLDWEEVPPAEKPVGAAPPAAHAKDRLSSPSNNHPSSGCSPSGFGWSSDPGGLTTSRSVSNADACITTPTTSRTPAVKDEALRPGTEKHHQYAGWRDALLENRVVKWEERDQIVSVFVVTFNTRTGETSIILHRIIVTTAIDILSRVRVDTAQVSDPLNEEYCVTGLHNLLRQAWLSCDL